MHSLGSKKLRQLADLFDEFKDVRLSRIPEQYGSRGKVDERRFELDRSFLRIMGMEPQESELRGLYAEIAQSLVQWIGA